MDILLNKNKCNFRPDQLVRQNGYAHIHDRITGKDSYVNRLTRHHYPRLHMYISETETAYKLSLHIDQKKVSYKGSNMHSAEYDGPVVEAEIARLKGIIRQNIVHNTGPETHNEEPRDQFNKIGHGTYSKDTISAEKKPWYKKLFK